MPAFDIPINSVTHAGPRRVTRAPVAEKAAGTISSPVSGMSPERRRGGGFGETSPAECRQ